MKTNRKIIFPLVAILLSFSNCKEKDDPCILSVTISNTSIGIGGILGLTAEAKDGLTPYSYQWSSGTHTTPSILGSFIGNYSVTVTDALGCTATDSWTICEGVQCENGKICVKGFCECPPGFTGDLCQTVVPAVPKKMIIQKVTIPTLYTVVGDWDSPPDLYLTINTGEIPNNTEFHTQQMFEQDHGPVTFDADFPYALDLVDSKYIIALWDDDTNGEDPGNTSGLPELVAESFSFKPVDFSPYPDNISVSGGSAPTYELKVTWEY